MYSTKPMYVNDLYINLKDKHWLKRVCNIKKKF